MEQKDYILREIEKIGLIIKLIRQKLFFSKENLSLSIENQFINMKEMLFEGTDFDFDKYSSMNLEESNEYINSFKGFSIENIELLAECIYEKCINENHPDAKKYLEKSLQLYELCNLKSKTYSIDRETIILKIKNALEK